MTPNNVEIIEKTTPFKAYLHVDHYLLKHALFEGGWSDVMSREVIERGHVYIAQPPLYKLKKGKSERYVKDDQALREYLVEIALNDTALFVDGSERSLSPEKLQTVASEYLLATSLIEHMAQRYDLLLLEAIRGMPALAPDVAYQEEALKNWLEALIARLLQLADNSIAFRSEVVKASVIGDFTGRVITTRHGVDIVTELGRELFVSTEYQKLTEIGQRLDAVGLLLRQCLRADRPDRREGVFVL